MIDAILAGQPIPDQPPASLSLPLPLRPRPTRDEAVHMLRGFTPSQLLDIFQEAMKP